MCAGWQALMLCSKLNSVLQFIYWASIYFLAVIDESTRWMCGICWKLTIKIPDYCQWGRSGVITDVLTWSTSCTSVFSVSIVDFVRVTVQKNRDIALLLFVIRHVWFFEESESDLWYFWNRSFCKNRLHFKVFKNLNREFHFKIYYVVLNCLGYFFRFTFSIDIFLFPNVNLQTWTLHTNVCSRYIIEALHWVWYLCEFDSRNTTTMSVILFWGFG